MLPDWWSSIITTRLRPPPPPITRNIIRCIRPTVCNISDSDTRCTTETCKNDAVYFLESHSHENAQTWRKGNQLSVSLTTHNNNAQILKNKITSSQNYTIEQARSGHCSTKYCSIFYNWDYTVADWMKYISVSSCNPPDSWSDGGLHHL